MPKIGLYVPPDRAEDIERFRKRVSFSQIFLAAFDAEIARQAAVSDLGDKELADCVERLRREADRSFDAGRTRGRQVGFRWAKDDALLGHLREVVDWKKPVPADMVRLLRDDYGMKFDELAPDLARISTNGPTDSDELGPELEDSSRGLEGELYMEGLARGFVEGAKQLWGRVKARVFSQGEGEPASQKERSS